MRRSLLLALAAGALVPAALAFASATAAPVRKCATGTGPPVWVLDGRVVEKREAEGPMVLGGKVIEPGEVESVSVACSRESHRVFGIEPGRDLVLVWTSAVPPAALKASVESIVPLQAAYLARHGVFAPALKSLRWREPSASISVRLCVSEDGKRWSALGWQSSPTEDLPRVLVMGERASEAATVPEPRYSCTVTPATPA